MMMRCKDGAARRRILLDSNVWRYVLDAGCAGALIRAAREGESEVLVAPAVVFEALRLKDVARRDALVRLMAHGAFHRLMPEAYSESVEILEEINRLHPGWFVRRPDVRFLRRLEADWRKKTGGFWVRLQRWPEKEARYIASMEGDTIAMGLAQAKHARKEIMESEWKKNPPMDKTLATFKHPTPGWRGDPIEAWRVDTFTIITFALNHTGNPYRDWIAPLVNFDHGLLLSREWAQFWLYEVDKAHLPRQWLRWAVSFAQRFRKVTPGTPADSQLSTYFLEADVVISADRILLDILEEVRPYAPGPLPCAQMIRGGAEGVDDLFAFLTTS